MKPHSSLIRSSPLSLLVKGRRLSVARGAGAPVGGGEIPQAVTGRGLLERVHPRRPDIRIGSL